MILLIPMGSKSEFFQHKEYKFPKPLVEISGKTMIHHVIDNLTSNCKFKKIIFIVMEDDCKNFHLDNTLELLCPFKPEIIQVKRETKGALCSVLLAIKHLTVDEPLIIANSDQLFDNGIHIQIDEFLKSDYDSGCITINSVHPRWSYIRYDTDMNVVEAAEKMPISKKAVAGVYMYKNSAEFIKFGMNNIRNGASVGDIYYISLVFNEYIINRKKVGFFQYPDDKFHTFYSPEKIKEYEELILKK